MITEDYVSFETAKLLKEKGFIEECHSSYNENGRIVDSYPSDESHHYYDRPTLQMAMKWLREVKQIFIEVFVDTIIKGAFAWRLFDYPSFEIMPYDGWEYTYEEACESAIKYCLENLI